MKIHYIQHVDFETPANILKWAEEKGHEISGTHLYENEKLPDLDQFDFLVVMGGPMGIYDEEKYPWLKEEKEFIKKAIENDKLVLGICLGAQLIADVLGAKVYKNKEKEIGWFPVELTEEAKNSNIFKDFPQQFMAFHWHGDTFDIPDGAVHTVRSEACENQAFEYNDGKVVALQFHLEVDKEAVERLIKNSQEELKEKGKYIQNPDEMLQNTEYFEEIKKLLFKMLDKLERINFKKDKLTFKDLLDPIKEYLPVLSIFATGYTTLLLILYFNDYGISIFDIGGENSLISLIPFILITTFIFLSLIFVFALTPFLPTIHILTQNQKDNLSVGIYILGYILAIFFTFIILNIISEIFFSINISIILFIISPFATILLNYCAIKTLSKPRNKNNFVTLFIIILTILFVVPFIFQDTRKSIFTLIGIHSNDNYPKIVYIKIPKEEKILENEIINKLNCSIITKNNSNDDFLSCSNRIISNLGSFIIFEDGNGKPFAVPKTFILGFRYKGKEKKLSSKEIYKRNIKVNEFIKYDIFNNIENISIPIDLDLPNNFIEIFFYTRNSKLNKLLKNRFNCKFYKTYYRCNNIINFKLNNKFLFLETENKGLMMFEPNKIFKRIEINLKEN